jgi:hypothetical protein
MYEEDEEIATTKDDKTCQQCGLRQYNDICVNCNIPIIEEDEKEKTKDDDDDYDRRERR